MKEKLIILFMIILGIISLGGRVWWGSADELDQAESAFKNKDYPSAIIHYEKVILWNFPFFDYKDKAMKGIQSIKEKARAENNQVVKRYAEDSLAFALTSTGNSPRTPNNSGNTSVPHRFWSAVVGISLLTWIGITFYLIGFFFDKNMSLRHKAGFIFTLCILTLILLLWIFSIHQL
jgi:hypothetical protein